MKATSVSELAITHEGGVYDRHPTTGRKDGPLLGYVRPETPSGSSQWIVSLPDGTRVSKARIRKDGIYDLFEHLSGPPSLG